jgi:hypothetical protein
MSRRPRLFCSLLEDPAHGHPDGLPRKCRRQVNLRGNAHSALMLRTNRDCSTWKRGWSCSRANCPTLTHFAAWQDSRAAPGRRPNRTLAFTSMARQHRGAPGGRISEGSISKSETAHEFASCSLRVVRASPEAYLPRSRARDGTAAPDNIVRYRTCERMSAELTLFDRLAWSPKLGQWGARPARVYALIRRSTCGVCARRGLPLTERPSYLSLSLLL